MFKVYFENQLFASAPTIEGACSLALAVHSSSNVPHVIEVKDVHGIRVISFERIDVPTK